MRQFSTLTDAIQSKSTSPDIGDIIEVTPTDGVPSRWTFSGTIGQTPSQSPSQLDDALFNDGNGNQWGFVGKALFLEQIGGVLDGVTLNDGVISAAKSYCTSTGNNIYFGIGTLLSGQILVTTGEELKLSGIDKVLSVHKIADGTNSNNAQVTGDGTGKLSLSNMTLDGNMDNQAGGGHGIRSAGCEKLWLTNILIKNSLNYGIGLQDGTSKNLKWRDVEINRCGSDGVDIKDYNFNNEVIDLVGFKCSGHGETNPQSPALDVRGGIIASNIEVDIIGDNYGLRFRFGDGVQGRDGFGSMSNAIITGDGVSASQALRCDSASDNFTYSDVTIDNCSTAINQNAAAIGGALSNITATQIHGGDGCSIGGTDLILSNFKISNKAGNTRLIDVEPTANNFQLSNFNAKDTIGANGIRIQALASDCSFTGGVIRNANYQDLGTGTVQSNVRLL